MNTILPSRPGVSRKSKSPPSSSVATTDFELADHTSHAKDSFSDDAPRSLYIPDVKNYPFQVNDAIFYRDRDVFIIVIGIVVQGRLHPRLHDLVRYSFGESLRRHDDCLKGLRCRRPDLVHAYRRCPIT